MEIKLVTDRKSLIFAAPESEEVSKALEQAKLTTKQIYEWGNETCPHHPPTKLTTKQIYEWGNETGPHHPPKGIYYYMHLKRECDLCWDSLQL